MMRSKEQIEADIEATMEQMESFSNRLDELNDELVKSELECGSDVDDIEDIAKYFKSVQSTFIKAGFTEEQSFELMLYILS